MTTTGEPFGQGPNHLVGRRHTKLRITQFQFPNGVSFGATLLDSYIQALGFEVPMNIGIDITDHAGIEKPFQPVGDCLRGLGTLTTSSEKQMENRKRNTDIF